jgi:DNA polymerase III subunit epsilon
LNNYSRGSYRQPRDERMSEADKDALHGLLGRASFVAFDFETTGLDAQKERIVEIGAVRFSMRERGGEWELATGEEYASLVNPGRPIPSQASAIHGISDLDVSFSPSFKEAAPDFLRFLGESVLVAHNAPFDLAFLAAECGRAGLAVPLNAAYDTKLIAKTAVPHLPSYSLKALSASFGIAQKEAHRGADDARVCMELFARCVRLLFL